jgi:hypothetical protein
MDKICTERVLIMVVHEQQVVICWMRFYNGVLLTEAISLHWLSMNPVTFILFGCITMQ